MRSKKTPPSVLADSDPLYQGRVPIVAWEPTLRLPESALESPQTLNKPKTIEALKARIRDLEEEVRALRGSR